MEFLDLFTRHVEPVLEVARGDKRFLPEEDLEGLHRVVLLLDPRAVIVEELIHAHRHRGVFIPQPIGEIREVDAVDIRVVLHNFFHCCNIPVVGKCHFNSSSKK